MTGAVFSDYFKNKLHAELKVYCKQEGIPFKILLVVDNTPSHPPHLADLTNNIKIVFLPPNTTSLIQPCDQGIIQTFKAHYLRTTLADLVKVTEQENITVRDYCRQFTIKDALCFIKQSWEEVPRSCLNGVWKKLCPHFVHNFKGFSNNDNVASANRKSLHFAQKLGFDELEDNDIDELLQSHQEELSNDDLLEIERERVQRMEEAEAAAAAAASQEPLRALTVTNLSQCMDLLRQAMKIIEENDPNVERSGAVTRDVLNRMSCYEVMLKEKQQKKKQQTITAFFQEAKPKPVMESDTDPDEPNTPYTEVELSNESEAEVESEAESDAERSSGEDSLREAATDPKLSSD